MIVQFSILGQEANEMQRGFYEAESDVLWRDAPAGLENDILYTQYVTGYGETSNEAIQNLIEKLQKMGIHGKLRKRKA
tara:strand:+ start:825 stop:1058 length:234 start_codon:yes stop_codon:yes gene_type:complete